MPVAADCDPGTLKAVRTPNDGRSAIVGGEQGVLTADRRPQIPLVATIPISPRQQRIAFGVIIGLVVIIFLTAPFAETALPRVDAFIPAVHSVMFIVNLITSVLLFAQFTVQPQRAVLIIASGYLFVAFVVMIHALTFPGAFAPAGLLGADRQTAGWIFYFWHTGFALAVIAYVLLNDTSREVPRRFIWHAVGVSASAVIAVTAALTLSATVGANLLPNLFLSDLRVNSTAHYLSSAVFLVNVLALMFLAFRRRFILDLWLIVALCVDLPDIGLAILLPVLRFSLGWYLARFFALTSASVLLVVLLAETMALYARLARTVVLQQRYRTRLEAMTRDLIAARDAAESANRAKSDFLARMSHEIRTPMTCVLGMADLLVESDLTRQQRRQATLLRDAGQSLLAIIDDLLDIAKIEAGKLELERVPFSTSAVAQSAVDIVSSVAAAKGLDLRTELASDLPSWIEGDPTRVRQILLNLLSNAIKFTKRGSIVLRVSRAPGAETSQLRFEVVDTGIGIDTTHQHLLFQRFSQIGRSCDRKLGGTGLGLAISRHLVEAMGGTFGVDSRIDAGSTFYFALPFVEAESQAAAHEKPPIAGAGSHARILVAEDHDIVRETIEAMLTGAGHEVVSARTGAEAIASLARRDFDVVLMDVQMPELDGIAAIERIRKMDERIRDIPIIALTAYAMPEDAERCRAAGANDHLPKPFERSDMLRLVAKWSANRHEFSATSRMDVAAPQIIDPAVLDRLEGRIGKARAIKFADLFCEQLETALATIAATSEHQRIAAETYELLSIAGILGCVELSARGCALMDAARSETGELGPLVAELTTAAGRASTAMRERYRS